MEAIDRILELTRRVQDEIDRGNWAQAGVLNNERQQLLANLVDDQGLDHLEPEALAALREVLDQNRQAIEAVKTKKSALLDDSQRLRRGAAAIRSYHSNAGGRRHKPAPGRPPEEAPQ